MDHSNPLGGTKEGNQAKRSTGHIRDSGQFDCKHGDRAAVDPANRETHLIALSAENNDIEHGQFIPIMRSPIVEPFMRALFFTNPLEIQ